MSLNNQRRLHASCSTYQTSWILDGLYLWKIRISCRGADPGVLYTLSPRIRLGSTELNADENANLLSPRTTRSIFSIRISMTSYTYRLIKYVMRGRHGYLWKLPLNLRYLVVSTWHSYSTSGKHHRVTTGQIVLHGIFEYYGVKPKTSIYEQEQQKSNKQSWCRWMRS